jgi:hypothetical protein
MNRSQDWYRATAHNAIVLFRQQSPNAAAALSQILDVHGAKAAYQASIVLIQLKSDVETLGKAKTLEQYEGAMLGFETVLPVFRRALRSFLIDYGMGIKKSRPAQAASASPSTQHEAVSD